MTSSHHGPYVQGDTRATMASTEGCKNREVEPIPKRGLSWDRSLQLDSVNAESLVIVDQPRHGEYVPGPCTHRPSHHESLLYPKPVS